MKSFCLTVKRAPHLICKRTVFIRNGFRIGSFAIKNEFLLSVYVSAPITSNLSASINFVRNNRTIQRMLTQMSRQELERVLLE